jgi:hypothetical protein
VLVPRVDRVADHEFVFTIMQPGIARSSPRSEADISAARMTKRSCKFRNRKRILNDGQ